jgi:D-tyrosyl-tRNA(Tyr) deacylase
VLLQRVRAAGARDEDGRVLATVGAGLVALTGFGPEDSPEVVDRMARRVANLRVFEHGDSLFGRSLLEEGGEALVVAQFTLYGDTSRGRRPSFSGALAPDLAEPLYERFVERLEVAGARRVVATPFAARIELELVNWGPFTLMMSTD